MRKLFELFLSFFRPISRHYVNTGYMSKHDLLCWREANGLCTECGSSEDVAPEGTHSDADGLCWKCFAKAELDYEG